MGRAVDSEAAWRRSVLGCIVRARAVALRRALISDDAVAASRSINTPRAGTGAPGSAVVLVWLLPAAAPPWRSGVL